MFLNARPISNIPFTRHPALSMTQNRTHTECILQSQRRAGFVYRTLNPSTRVLGGGARLTWHPKRRNRPSWRGAPAIAIAGNRARARGHAPRAHRRCHAPRLDAQPPPRRRSVHAHQLTARRVPHRCPQRAAYPASRTSHCCTAPERKCHHRPTMPPTVRKAAQNHHAPSPAADVCLTPRPALRLSICRLPRKHVRGSPWHHPWRAIA